MKKIKNLNEVNEALHRIAEIDLEIAGHTAERDDTITQAKNDCDVACRDIADERDAIIDQLHTFTDDNRDDAIPEGKKSLELANGIVGYHQTPDAIEVSEHTAELLIAAGLKQCVKIKQEPVKAAMKGMCDADLSRYEAKRIPGKESFYATANEIRTSVPNTAA